MAIIDTMATIEIENQRTLKRLDRLELSLDTNFISPEIIETNIKNTYIVLKDLSQASKLSKYSIYSWRVQAKDNSGLISAYSNYRHFMYIGNPVSIAQPIIMKGIGQLSDKGKELLYDISGKRVQIGTASSGIYILKNDNGLEVKKVLIIR